MAKKNLLCILATITVAFMLMACSTNGQSAGTEAPTPNSESNIAETIPNAESPELPTPNDDASVKIKKRNKLGNGAGGHSKIEKRQPITEDRIEKAQELIDIVKERDASLYETIMQGIEKMREQDNGGNRTDAELLVEMFDMAGEDLDAALEEVKNAM